MIGEYLTTSKAFNIIGQPHGCEITVGAVSSEGQNGWHHKLMKMCTGWSPTLLPWCYPLAHDPCLTILSNLILGHLDEVVLAICRGFLLYILKSFSR